MDLDEKEKCSNFTCAVVSYIGEYRAIIVKAWFKFIGRDQFKWRYYF